MELEMEKLETCQQLNTVRDVTPFFGNTKQVSLMMPSVFFCFKLTLLTLFEFRFAIAQTHINTIYIYRYRYR